MSSLFYSFVTHYLFVDYITQFPKFDYLLIIVIYWEHVLNTGA